MLEEKKFGFYSPAFDYFSDTREVFAMLSAGLTNKPNLCPPLNSQEDYTVKLPVILTQLLEPG